MQHDANRLRTLRMHGSNRLACLICYLVAFGIPAVWEWAALSLLYPRKLAFTAPDAAGQLLKVFPVLERWISPVGISGAENAFSLREMLLAREHFWLTMLALCALTAWAVTLLLQLCWRFGHRNPLFSARRTAAAIRTYRLTMVIIWLLNVLIAAGIWLFGVQFVTGRTLWDYLISFSIYLLLPFSAAFVSRFAASPAISGKHAFFKRI